MKYRILSILGLGSPLLALAQDAQNPIDQITTSLGTQMTSWSNSITTFFTSNMSTIMGVVGIGIAIALLWVGFRLFKKATSKAA